MHLTWVSEQFKATDSNEQISFNRRVWLQKRYKKSWSEDWVEAKHDRQRLLRLGLEQDVFKRKSQVGHHRFALWSWQDFDWNYSSMHNQEEHFGSLHFPGEFWTMETRVSQVVRHQSSRCYHFHFLNSKESRKQRTVFFFVGIQNPGTVWYKVSCLNLHILDAKLLRIKGRGN